MQSTHVGWRALANAKNTMVHSLILKRASTSRLSGEWNEDDYDVLTDGGVVVGRIFKVRAAPGGTPWMWTLAFGHHDGYSPVSDLRLNVERAFHPCFHQRDK
jgi:hypothetical protein